MSKRFKRQDYFRYKRLGKKWRRSVGWQSKMRLGKGGAGLTPGVGYGTPGKMTATLVKNIKDLEKDCRYGIIFAGALGSKKVAEFTKIAKEKGFTILNMKKVKRAKAIEKGIAKNKQGHKEEHKHEAHKEEHKHEDHIHENDHKHETKEAAKSTHEKKEHGGQ